MGSLRNPKIYLQIHLRIHCHTNFKKVDTLIGFEKKNVSIKGGASTYDHVPSGVVFGTLRLHTRVRVIVDAEV